MSRIFVDARLSSRGDETAWTLTNRVERANRSFLLCGGRGRFLGRRRPRLIRIGAAECRSPPRQPRATPAGCRPSCGGWLIRPALWGEETQYLAIIDPDHR